MYEVRCSEIWGGIRGNDLEVATSGLRASLFSAACDGGKGGDLYYFSVCGSDLLSRIAIADVMGHGAAVSNTSQWLYDSLEARMNSAEGNEVLADLNRLACEYGYRAMTTGLVAAYYLSTGRLYYSYAGHHPALVRRTADSQWQTAELPQTEGAANLPLGVDVDAEFTQSDTPFAHGDQVFIYTDGVIEAPGRDGTLFGEPRLRSVLDECALRGDDPVRMKQTVLASLLEHTGGALKHDDVTFMMIEIR